MSSTMAAMQQKQQQQQQQQQQPHCRQDSYDEEIYTEFRQPTTEDQRLASGKMVESPRKLGLTVSSSSPPPLPRKNALRTRSRSTSLSSSTRILDSTASLGSSKEVLVNYATGTTKQAASTLHDVYLSSEEDASSSADDFSDFEWESGSEYEYAEDVQIAEASSSSSSMGSPSGGPRRRSHEITARVVSVVYIGKPAIVNLPNPTKRISRSPNSSTSNSTPSPINIKAASAAPPNSSLPTPSRRRSVGATTSFARRLSISSTASFSTGPSTTTTPVKAKSVIASVFSRKGQQPLFLNTDPFANGSSASLVTPPRRASSRSVSSGSPAVTPLAADEGNAARTPKTPTEKFKDFSLRGGALLKKRSRSIMNAATSLRDSYNGAGVATLPEENGSSRDTSRASTPASTPYDRTQSSMDYFSSPAGSLAVRSLPVRAQSDIAIATAPVSPTDMKGKRFTALSTRRRSSKATSKP